MCWEKTALRFTLNTILISSKLMFICLGYLKLPCKLKLLSTSFEVWNSSVNLLFQLVLHVLLFLFVLNETRRKYCAFFTDVSLNILIFFLCYRRCLDNVLMMSVTTYFCTLPLCCYLHAALNDAQCTRSWMAASLCKHSNLTSFPSIAQVQSRNWSD